MKPDLAKWIKALTFCSAVVLFISCDDRNEPVGKGNVQFELTDAPSDDANVKNVFVTVTDIKVDGVSIGNIPPQTLDLKAYSAGSTKLLATAEQVDAKTYNSVTLVLDVNEDANGNAPGCFVKTGDGKSYQLKNSTDGKLELVILKKFNVDANGTTQLVIDFDIRKTIAYNANDPLKYSFVADNEMNRAIRMVEKKKTGTIKGVIDAGSNANEKLIVYAYKKGMFSASTETEPQGTHQIYFMNAASSTEVGHSLKGRSFKLAFMEEGDYELYFASYAVSPSGRTSFKTVLQTQTVVTGTSGNTISVDAGASIDISSTIVGGIL